MAVTLEDFRAFFPEFVDATDELIELHLADARVITKEDVFFATTDIITKYRAADSLATSPWGRYARLSDDTSRTIYGKKVDEYIKMAPLAGPWVPGVCGSNGRRNLNVGLEPGDL